MTANDGAISVADDGFAYAKFIEGRAQVVGVVFAECPRIVLLRGKLGEFFSF